MSRTTIKRDGSNVVLSYTTATGERVTRTFCSYGKYVHERNARGNLRQVCDRLYTTGPTLRESGDLLEQIRREWRAARRAEARHDR